MRSANSAEWIIARFTSQGRASSIVGDLLEAAPQKGMFWFWMSIARVVVSLTWRPSIAFVAALVFLRIANRAVNIHLRDLSIVHHLFGWTWQLSYLVQAAVILSFPLAYMVIRYGLKDTLARYTFVAWLLVGAAFIFVRIMPLVTLAIVTLGVCFLVYSAMSAQRRKGLFALMNAFSLSVGLVFLSRLLFVTTLRLGRFDLPVFIPGRFLYVFGFIVLVGQAFIFSRVHRAFLERDSHDGDNLSGADVSPANS